MIKITVLDENNFCIREVVNKEIPCSSIIVIYPIEFIGDPVLEENIPKMISVVREYIKEFESYLMFKNMIGNARWDSEKLKYGRNMQYRNFHTDIINRKNTKNLRSAEKSRRSENQNTSGNFAGSKRQRTSGADA